MQAGSLTNAHRVIKAVAERKGKDETELPPLSDAIDPEALNALFFTTADRTPRGDGYVTFSYCGHVVTVYSDGRVTLDEAAPSLAVEQ